MTKINIVIPAYNEEKRIRETINALHQFTQKNKVIKNIEIDYHVVIVDDGSKDKTIDVCRESLEEHNISHKIFTYAKNHGKGYAVKFGILNSRIADFYYLADSDLSCEWHVLKQLFIELIETEAECVIASRSLPSSEVDTSLRRKIGGKVSNIMINTILNLKIADTQCGYKLFSAKTLPAFRLQKLDRFGFDFEILYIIQQVLNLRIIEVGVKWENKAGSKVKFSDYFKTLNELLKVKTNTYQLDSINSDPPPSSTFTK